MRVFLCLSVAAGLIWHLPMAWAQTPAYQPVPSFPRWPEGMKCGAVSGVAINKAGDILIAHRNGPPISIFTKDGEHVRSFGDKIFTAIHGIRVDQDDQIWATDMKIHIVVKMDMTGRLLMTLGERNVPGEDGSHFNRPTDVAVAPDGDFFVSDGYGNSRIVKFDPNGKFIKAWGSRGTGKGQFHLPHALVIDGQGLVYVADRENKRIQVFAADGNFIRQIDGITPYGICLAPDGKLYIADGRASTVTRMTLAGRVELSWGGKGSGPGEFNMPHGIAVGADGSVYVAEINGERLQKFVPR